MTVQTLAKACRLMRRRPTALYASARESTLFLLTHLLLKGLRPPGVEFGRNVRLQRLSSLLAEAPDARIRLGDDVIIYEDCRLQAFGAGCLSIGSCSILGGARIACRSRVTIGERVLTSWNVFIQDFDPHPRSPSERARQVEDRAKNFFPSFSKRNPEHERGKWEFSRADIVIGDDVWIGANATILKGAVIGRGCIVAAGAVVTRGSYGPGTLIAGNPAREVKRIDDSSCDDDHGVEHTRRIVSSGVSN